MFSDWFYENLQIFFPIIFWKTCFIIKVGSKLPAGELFENSPASKVDIHELFAGKKGILIGVPG